MQIFCSVPKTRHTTSEAVRSGARRGGGARRGQGGWGETGRVGAARNARYSNSSFSRWQKGQKILGHALHDEDI